MDYNDDIPLYLLPWSIESFKSACAVGNLIDYDGWGHPSDGKKMNASMRIYPSALHLIPPETTHVIWMDK